MMLIELIRCKIILIDIICCYGVERNFSLGNQSAFGFKMFQDRQRALTSKIENFH